MYVQRCNGIDAAKDCVFPLQKTHVNLTLRVNNTFHICEHVNNRAHVIFPHATSSHVIM
jgi:hypothetical protein